MKKKLFIILPMILLLTMPLMSYAAGAAYDYNGALINNLTQRAELIYEASIVKITDNGDALLRCVLELEAIYKQTDLDCSKIHSKYSVDLPSAELGDRVFVFVKWDKDKKAYVRAISPGTLKSIVYRNADYRSVKKAFPDSEIFRDKIELKQARTEIILGDAGDEAIKYFDDKQNIYGGFYYDRYGYLTIRVTDTAAFSGIKKDLQNLMGTKLFKYIRIEKGMVTMVELAKLRQIIEKKESTVAPSILNRIDMVGYGISMEAAAVQVDIKHLNVEKENLFRKYISDSTLITLRSVESHIIAD